MPIPPPDDNRYESPGSNPDQQLFDSVFGAGFPANVEPVSENVLPPPAPAQHSVVTPVPTPVPVPTSVPAPAPMSARHSEREVRSPSSSPLPLRGPATETVPIAVFAVVAGMAVMPMFLTHMRHLSHMPHRAHYGFVLLGFIGLVFQRWYRATDAPSFRFNITDAALLVSAGVSFATASRVGSPWIAVLSCILLAGVFLRRLPSVENVGYTGPWAFLLLLLPFPLGMDQQLVRSLQGFATGCSSRLLDLVGVNHLVSGNILEIPGQRLFIDEACSGVQSLFAMLTCIAFFTAWTRRPAVLAIPLIGAGVVMCTIVNILRIVIVVHAETRGISLTEGWAHECLGTGLFMFALGLVYCSEGFFLFLLAPIINPATGTPDNRSARFWNNLTRSIHSAVYGVLETERSVVQPKPARGVFGLQLPVAFTRYAVFASTVCFAFFGLSQHVGGADREFGGRITQVEEAMLSRSEALQEDSLPEVFGPWKRVSFERLEPEKGPESVTWKYRSPFYQATVSLDYPFFGAHNVSDCYHLAGWNVQERVTTAAGFSKATLSRPFGETALLYYDMFEAAGTVELETTTGRLTERLKEFEDTSDRPTWQLQLIVQSDFGLTTTDLEDIEIAFHDLRKQLRGQVAGSSNQPIVPELRGEAQ